MSMDDEIEIFEHTAYHEPGELELEPGWYYWYRVPGCLPDSDPYGPFATEAAAVADWKAEHEDAAD